MKCAQGDCQIKVRSKECSNIRSGLMNKLQKVDDGDFEHFAFSSRLQVPEMTASILYTPQLQTYHNGM